MELAVILVLLVIIELALTCYFLGRIRDYRRTVDELVDHMSNLEHGLDKALTTLGIAQSRLESVNNDTDDCASGLAAAAQVAATASPDEVAQAKAVLEQLGIKMD